ncbi:hypothetical protein F66182_5883 [Fusarium sp. NRRL 66182]|nr:hypothetical protein F66182_5883 [Fusarium sp. NRRL 66182]
MENDSNSPVGTIAGAASPNAMPPFLTLAATARQCQSIPSGAITVLRLSDSNDYKVPPPGLALLSSPLFSLHHRQIFATPSFTAYVCNDLISGYTLLSRLYLI